jgi:elongation factor G
MSLGTLKRSVTLHNSSRNQKEKASKMLLMYANEPEEVDELPFGSVGVILGLKFTRTGDTLVAAHGKAGEEMPMQHITPPLPVVATSVIPETTADTFPVQSALEALSRTDPSVRLENKEGQLLVHGLGSLHLEIVERRLKDEWGVNFEFGKQRVSYREGLVAMDDAVEEGEWTANVAGKPVPLQLTLSLRPLIEGETGDDAWDGNLVLDSHGKPIPGAFVARGLATTLSNSPHSALGMSGLRIKVLDFKHPPHVHPSLLTGAAAYILRERLKAVGMGPIMEPYIRLRISVHEDSIGKVIKDLTENSGEVLDLEGSASSHEEAGGYPEDGVYIPPDWMSPSGSISAIKSGTGVTLRRSIEAIAPLSRMLDYSNRLRALSGGHGSFEMSNAGFREVSEVRKLEILREIGRA